ncbi:hypothetical protein ACI2LP_34330, partial [Streptomyces sp. NPDC019890]
LASYLQANTTAGGTGRRLDGRTLSSTDLILHELWPLAGARRPRAIATLLAAALIAPAPVAWAMLQLTAGPLNPASIILILLFVVMCLATAGLWQPEWPQPHRISRERLQALHPWRVSVGGLFLVLLGLWHTSGWIVAALCALGMHYHLLGGDRAPVTDPRIPLREDSKNWFVLTALLTGLGAVLVALDWHDNPGTNILNATLVLGVAVLTTAWLTAGLLVRPLVAAAAVAFAYSDPLRTSWVQRAHTLAVGSRDRMERGMALGACLRYLALLLCTCTRGRLPWRLGRFLDDCYHLGLLRIAGAGWQFRHRELQEHLAANTRPPSTQ